MLLFQAWACLVALLAVGAVGAVGAPAQCEGELLAPAAGDCATYFRCVGGRPALLNCPDGAHFNARTGQCGHPDTEGCGDGEGRGEAGAGKGREHEEVEKGIQPENVGKRIQPENVGKGIQPEKVGKCIQPEKVGKGIQPEKVGKGIQPEKVGKGIQPEEVGKGIQPGNVGKGMEPKEEARSVQEEVGIITEPEEVGTVSEPEEVWTGIEPEQVGSGSKPEDKVVGKQQQQPKQEAKELGPQRGPEEEEEEEEGGNELQREPGRRREEQGTRRYPEEQELGKYPKVQKAGKESGKHVLRREPKAESEYKLQTRPGHLTSKQVSQADPKPRHDQKAQPKYDSRRSMYEQAAGRRTTQTPQPSSRQNTNSKQTAQYVSRQKVQPDLLRCEKRVCEKPSSKSVPVLSSLHSGSLCVWQDNGKVFPNPKNCSQYFLCDNGQLIQLDCSEGLVFNPDTSSCEPSDSTECGEKHRDDPVCPPPGPGPLQVFPHPTDCSKYRVCDNGELVTMDCPPGLHFNPKKKVCDFPYVAGCQLEKNLLLRMYDLFKQRHLNT